MVGGPGYVGLLDNNKGEKMTNQNDAAFKHKDISRIDQDSKRTHGWYTRISFHGKTYSKFFSDKKSGGKNLALLSALAWRDLTRAKIGKPQSDRHIVTVARNNTGIVGVRLNEKMSRYEVSWVNPDGRQGKTTVSFNKRGKAAALKLAVRKREEKNQKRITAD
jgi:hypothetical protein